MTQRSLITVQRPELWRQAVDMATGLTGMLYVPKLPLADGTVYACGGGVYPSVYVPPERIKTPNEIERDRKEKEKRDLEREIADVEEQIRRNDLAINDNDERARDLLELDETLKARLKSLRSKRGLTAAPVPTGAMEWLLHEVGHWVAATPEERARPNYGLTESQVGHDGEREWQAWAFEEIVLSPWAPARDLAPPTQRDGAGFSRQGPIARQHLRHVERRMAELGIAVEPWRIVWGEWVRWGRSLGDRTPWNTER